jgi:glycerol-3-phosphate dehydrogenase
VSIADYAISLLQEMGLERAPHAEFCPVREDPHAFRRMSDEEKDAFIRENPDYGKIVCRCEGITEGEIRQALRMNPPALDMDGVKRRTRSGMGRCQGGFCAPYVMKLIAEERQIELEQVTKNGGSSNMLTGRI